MPSASPWTADFVGRRLIEAFRLMPGRPVMSSPRGFTVDGVEVEPFGWPEATTERRRKVALATIAAGLTREGRGEAAA